MASALNVVDGMAAREGLETLTVAFAGVTGAVMMVSLTGGTVAGALEGAGRVMAMVFTILLVSAELSAVRIHGLGLGIGAGVATAGVAVDPVTSAGLAAATCVVLPIMLWRETSPA